MTVRVCVWMRTSVGVGVRVCVNCTPGTGTHPHRRCSGRRRSPFWGARGQPARRCPRRRGRNTAIVPAPESSSRKSHKTEVYSLQGGERDSVRDIEPT